MSSVQLSNPWTCKSKLATDGDKVLSTSFKYYIIQVNNFKL